MKRLLPLLALLGACSAPPPDPEPDAPQPAAGSPRPTAPAKPVPARAFDESLLTGREFLLEARSSAEARDFFLGALRQDEAAAAVRGFLGGLPVPVSPRWTSYLKDWAAAHPVKGDVLVGKGMEKEGLLLLPFRTKDQRGWAALERGNEGWILSDVQVEEAPADAAPFDPEAPQEISSPSLR